MITKEEFVERYNGIPWDTVELLENLAGMLDENEPLNKEAKVALEAIKRINNCLAELEFELG